MKVPFQPEITPRIKPKIQKKQSMREKEITLSKVASKIDNGLKLKLDFTDSNFKMVRNKSDFPVKFERSIPNNKEGKTGDREEESP